MFEVERFNKQVGDVVLCNIHGDNEYMATIIEINEEEEYCVVTDQNDEVFDVAFDDMEE